MGRVPRQARFHNISHIVPHIYFSLVLSQACLRFVRRVSCCFFSRVDLTGSGSLANERSKVLAYYRGLSSILCDTTAAAYF